MSLSLGEASGAGTGLAVLWEPGVAGRRIAASSCERSSPRRLKGAVDPGDGRRWPGVPDECSEDRVRVVPDIIVAAEVDHPAPHVDQVGTFRHRGLMSIARRFVGKLISWLRLDPTPTRVRAIDPADTLSRSTGG